MKSNTLLLGFLCLVSSTGWGAFGILLYEAVVRLGGSPFAPYPVIGICYLLFGFLGSLLVLHLNGELRSEWNRKGMLSASSAGVAASLAVVPLTLSVKLAGGPQYVMSLIFGLTPSVTGLLNWKISGKPPVKLFWPISIVIGIAGALLVWVKPIDTNKLSVAEASENWIWASVALVVVLFWSYYGPALGRAKKSMPGTANMAAAKSFACLSLAYGLLALLCSPIALLLTEKKFVFDWVGVACAAGVGVIGIIASAAANLSAHSVQEDKVGMVIAASWSGAPVVNGIICWGLYGLGTVSIPIFFGSQVTIILGCFLVLYLNGRK